MAGHHKKAISEALRLGSSRGGQVMAKWRWEQYRAAQQIINEVVNNKQVQTGFFNFLTRLFR